MSCNKDSDNNSSTPVPVNPSGGNTSSEGIYHPSKKISQVITHVYDDLIYKQEWIWGENDDLQLFYNYRSYNGVEYDYNYSTRFTYDNKYRIVRIEDLDNSLDSWEYFYDGNKLKTVNYYEGGSFLATIYTFTYTNGKVTKIEELDFEDKQGVSQKGSHGLEWIMGKELAKRIETPIQRHRSKAGSKGTDKYIIDLTWKNDNITKIMFSEEADPNWHFTEEAEYDSYHNPYCGFYWIWGETVWASKNNCTKINSKETYNYDGSVSEYEYTSNYEYSYSGNYPITRRTVYSDGSIGDYIEYEYIQ